MCEARLSEHQRMPLRSALPVEAWDASQRRRPSTAHLLSLFATAAAGGNMYQIETEGDMLVSAALSSSGECLAFGGSGGYLHLWAPSADPAVNQMRQVRCS